jgi:hypothetical protein
MPNEPGGPWVPTVKREPASTVTVLIFPTVTLLVTVRVERFVTVRLPASEAEEEPRAILFAKALPAPAAPSIVGLGVLVLIMTGSFAVGIPWGLQLMPFVSNQPGDTFPVHVLVVWPKAAPAKVIFRVIIAVPASRRWTSAVA